MNWLFLRGLVREQRHWGSFLEVFQKTFPHDKIYCLDFPGVGTEHRRNSPAFVEDIVYDVRERWIGLAQDNAGSWGLLAMSLGGMVAMEWAALYPKDFERLVLINSSAANLSLPTERIRWQILPDFIKTAFSQDAAEREKIIFKMTSSMQDNVSVLIEQWAQIESSAPTTLATALAQLTAGAFYRAPATLQVPTLVMSALQDRLVNPECSALLAERFGAAHEKHPQAGHDLTLDDPEWVAETLRTWLRKG